MLGQRVVDGVDGFQALFRCFARLLDLFRSRVGQHDRAEAAREEAEDAVGRDDLLRRLLVRDLLRRRLHRRLEHADHVEEILLSELGRYRVEDRGFFLLDVQKARSAIELLLINNIPSFAFGHATTAKEQWLRSV